VAVRLVAVALFCVGGVLAGVASHAGDDDKAPAYKIYIDPETGGYTTEDPAARLEVTPVVRAASEPVPQADGSDRLVAAITAILLVGLLAGAIIVYRR
jgi:hypothetical protein